MRRVLPFLVASFIAVPAYAAPHSVSNSGTSWVPKELSIAVGDTVTFNWMGTHNVRFTDGDPGSDAAGYTRTFSQAGDVQFHCEFHLAEGMTGTVHVGATAATPTPTPGTTPTPPPTPTPTPSPTATPVDVTSPRFTTARASGFRTGLKVTIALNKPGQAAGVLERRGRSGFRRFGTLRFAGLGTAPRSFRVRRTREGKRVRAGRYRLKLATAPGTAAYRRTLLARVP